MTSTQIMVAIKTMFTMKGISVNPNWLRKSIDNNTNEEDLFGKVYKDYLMSDLKHSGSRSLKPIIERKGVSVDCKEIFVVQMQYLFEINTMPDIQLRRLRLGTLFWGDHAEDDVKLFHDIKARKFHLILSDGTDTITAIEATPIPELNTQLAPGSKLLLEGPMRYISNLLYLESRNVKVLGGGVKEMAVSNCYENILLKTLLCAETDSPRTYQESGFRRENLVETKDTVGLGSFGDFVAENVKEADAIRTESNNIKSNDLKVHETNQLSPHFCGFESNAGIGGLNGNIKSHSFQASNLPTHIDGELSNRNGETNSTRYPKRLCTRNLAGPKFNKSEANENHGNGNIIPENHANSHSTQSPKSGKSNGEVNVKNIWLDKEPNTSSSTKQVGDDPKFTGIEQKEGNEVVISGLEYEAPHLSKEFVDKKSLSTQPPNSLTEIDGEQSIKNKIKVTEVITPPAKLSGSGSNTDNLKPIDQRKSSSRHTANSSDHHNKSLQGLSKQIGNGSKSIGIELKGGNKAKISGLEDKSSQVVDSKSHSAQTSNSLTEIDEAQSIPNKMNVTEPITTSPKLSASGSDADNVKLDRNKSNSRHTANSSDHHNKSHHGSNDKAKQQANKRKADEDFESLYNDMRKKRNKLYDEKKILMKENEALRQKVDVTEKVVATLNEERTQFEQEINIREESLKEANCEKTRLEEELKVVRTQEEVLQMQVQLHETEQYQLRAQLEAQLVATTTVNNLLQQQIDNAKRYLKNSAKDSTVVQEVPTANISVENSVSHVTENTTASKKLKIQAPKPYKCNYCDKSYMRQDTRYKHYSRQHKEELKQRKKLDPMNPMNTSSFSQSENSPPTI